MIWKGQRPGPISWKGLLIALDHIDEVINLIRSSRTDQIAKEGLMEKFGLSERQAQAILDMRLRRLTGLEKGETGRGI